MVASVLAVLAGCGRQEQASSVVDVRGDLPSLALTMTRSRDGATVDGSSYRGRVVALYFGYTHCPDLCPMTLGNLSGALARLGPQASRAAILFVTVDLARDDISTLQAYAASFGPEVDGLRGTPDQIVALTRRYRVAYTFEPKTADGDYDVNHSSAVFVFDGFGRARFIATTTSSEDAIAEGLRRLVDETLAVATTTGAPQAARARSP